MFNRGVSLSAKEQKCQLTFSKKMLIVLLCRKRLPHKTRMRIRIQLCSRKGHFLFLKFAGRPAHRHLNKQTAHWPGPPAFVDTSSYVACHCCRHKTHFGAVCGASVLICPCILHQAAGLPTTANEQPISLRCLSQQVLIKSHPMCNKKVAQKLLRQFLLKN